MKKITIVGCGNIGSRHLQAISQIKESLEINIVEPDEKSRKAALERLEEISFDASNQKYTWCKNIEELSKKSDVTIISTSAKNRVEVIKKLLEYSKIWSLFMASFL